MYKECEKIYEAMESAFRMCGYSFSGQLIKPKHKKNIISIFFDNFILEDLKEPEAFREKLDVCLKIVFNSDKSDSKWELDNVPSLICPEKNNSQYNNLLTNTIKSFFSKKKV